MKKLSRLMLIGISFLAFSDVSFADDNADHDVISMKIKSATPVFLKSDNQAVAIPAIAEGNTLIVDKNTTHSTTIYDADMHPIQVITWSKTNDQLALIDVHAADLAKDTAKADAIVNENSIDVTLSDATTNAPLTTEPVTNAILTLDSQPLTEPASATVFDPSAKVLY